MESKTFSSLFLKICFSNELVHNCQVSREFGRLDSAVRIRPIFPEIVRIFFRTQEFFSRIARDFFRCFVHLGTYNIIFFLQSDAGIFLISSRSKGIKNVGNILVTSRFQHKMLSRYISYYKYIHIYEMFQDYILK